MPNTPALVGAGIYFAATSKKDGNMESDVDRERQKYSIKGMTDFIKHEFDEITRMNLYDLALSEDEFELITQFRLLSSEKQALIKGFLLHNEIITTGLAGSLLCGYKPLFPANL